MTMMLMVTLTSCNSAGPSSFSSMTGGGTVARRIVGDEDASGLEGVGDNDGDWVGSIGVGAGVGVAVGVAVGVDIDVGAGVVGDVVGATVGVEVVGAVVGAVGDVVGATVGVEVVGTAMVGAVGTNVMFWQQLPPRLRWPDRG